ncbi:hypothetical protein AHAS_Ahas03G0247100 [Arachis hypogaea]
MVECGNDRCKDSSSKQYDGMCRCSLAVVALRSKTNANPGRIKTRIANIFNGLMNWKSKTWLKRRNVLGTTNLCASHKIYVQLLA